MIAVYVILGLPAFLSLALLIWALIPASIPSVVDKKTHPPQHCFNREDRSWRCGSRDCSLPKVAFIAEMTQNPGFSDG